MTKLKRLNPIVVNAVVWAIMILLTAWLTRQSVDSPTATMLMMVHLVGWLTTNNLVKAKHQDTPPSTS